MFNITPYAAQFYHLVATADGTLRDKWTNCQVIGIDATNDDVRYIVEMRDSDGSFSLERAEIIRKLPKPVG